MRRDIPTLPEVRRITEKPRDAWWTVLLVDPVATPLVRWVARRTRLTPNQLTCAALLLGLGAAGCFATGAGPWLALGALLYHLSFVLDCMDGKLARLTGTGSALGGWLDYVFDRVRVLACAVALMGGQFARTDEPLYLWLAVAVVALDALRYLNALQTFRVTEEMRAERAARAGRDAAGAGGAHQPDEPAGAARVAGAVAGAGGAGGGARPSGARRFALALQRRRIRAHLVSGIEFQMAVFVVGPLVGAVAPVTVGAGALLLLFECAVCARLVCTTREHARALAALDRDTAPGSADAAPAEPPAPDVPDVPDVPVAAEAAVTADAAPGPGARPVA